MGEMRSQRKRIIIPINFSGGGKESKKKWNIRVNYSFSLRLRFILMDNWLKWNMKKRKCESIYLKKVCCSGSMP